MPATSSNQVSQLGHISLPVYYFLVIQQARQNIERTDEISSISLVP